MIHRPDRFNETEWFHFFLTNFERHYFGNRAPFGVFLLEATLYPYPAVQRALERFLDVVNNLQDVFMVTDLRFITAFSNTCIRLLENKQGQ